MYNLIEFVCNAKCGLPWWMRQEMLPKKRQADGDPPRAEQLRERNLGTTCPNRSDG